MPFKRFTIANLKPQSELEGISIYWLHFALAYVFVFYSLWLMNYHYEVCQQEQDERSKCSRPSAILRPMRTSLLCLSLHACQQSQSP